MKKYGVLISLVCLLGFYQVAKAEQDSSVTSAQAQTGTKTGIVLTARPLLGFVNPKELNDLNSYSNAALGKVGFTGVDAPSMSNSLQAEIYLGYAFGEDLDVGAFFSMPPVSTKTYSGTAPTKAAVTRTVGLKGTVLGVQGNYTFYRASGFKFYASPSVGLGTITVRDKLDGFAPADYDYLFDGKNAALRGSLGAAYQISSMFSVQLEGGYTYWTSGKMTHRNTTAKVAAGDTAQNTSGSDLVTNLSGPFVGLGMTIRYPI
ncbi:MAG: hypothetical protein HY843_09050 [Bdellovibrio sp.]|nr:hypothetical protein [Bdellovibrio sp.]